MAAEQTERFTRRHFVVGGLAAAGGAPLAYFVASAPGATTGDRLFGVIERIDLPRRVVVRSDGQRLVELASGASLWRDGAVGLSSFRVGDEVAFEGGFEGEIFRATNMSSAYRFIDGTVRRRRGEILELPDVRVRLSPKTIARGSIDAAARSPSDIGAGNHVVGIGRWEPASNDVLALQLGVRA
ncbi:MAG: hypothetical protein ACRDNB_07520 [Gaiellaceae bacterium]